MKNRMLPIIIALFVFLVIPIDVNAASFTLSVSCKSVIVGTATECTVKGNVTGTQVTGFQANYTISGGAFKSFQRGSGWEGQGDGGRIELYTDKSFNGTFTIGVITINTSVAGTGRISFTNIGAADNNFMEIGNIPNASGTFKVNAKPSTTKTTTTTTTRKTTTKKPTSTTLKITTQTTTGTTQPTTQKPLTLSSVKVDDYEVTYEDGKYYTTVEAYDTEVDISATAAEGITIIGAGTRTLVTGKNVVDLILRNTYGQTTTIQVIITKPDDAGAYDTTLASLQVVNFETKYDESKKQYTVTVPFDTKEIYVIAKGKSEDVIITGDGLYDLGNTKEVSIRVSYGDLESTEYTLVIKKSYGLIVIWIVIAGLTAGIGGVYYYMNKKQKNQIDKTTSQANKEKAAQNRQAQAEGQSLSINGEKNAGIGKRMVAPTPVMASQSNEENKTVDNLPQSTTAGNVPKPTQVVQKTTTDQPPQAAPTPVQKQVVVKKAPVQVVSSAPEPQVKLVRTAQTNGAPATNNPGTPNNEQVVVKNI